MDTMTFPSPGQVRFEIEIGAGEVQATASERADTTVEIDVRKGPDPEVTHREGPDGITITIRAKKARRQDYAIFIACPEGTSFEITTGSADMITPAACTPGCRISPSMPRALSTTCLTSASAS